MEQTQHEFVKEYKVPALATYGEPGDIVETILKSGGIGYYLEQMPKNSLGAISSRNPKQFDQLVALKKSNSDVRGLIGMLTATGRQIRKGKIQAQSVIDQMTSVKLNLPDGSTQVSSELAWGVWRWSNYLVDANKRKKTALVRNGAIVATLAAGAVLSAGKISENKKVAQPLVSSVTPNSLVIPKVTETKTPTSTPEPTATLEPEAQIGRDWKLLIEKHKKDGHDFLGSKVVLAEDIKDMDQFKQAVGNFVEKHNMLSSNSSISYNPGEPSEIYLWTRKQDNALLVFFDGPRVFPPWVAHTFYYNPNEGVCSAVADQPLADGSWQNTEQKFDPDNPKTCIAVAQTQSGRNIVVQFKTNQGNIEAKAVIFKAEF